MKSLRIDAISFISPERIPPIIENKNKTVTERINIFTKLTRPLMIE
ncbi:hypothetical protein SNE16_20280 [Pectobacterium carotovorum subsp. carotovorum]|nr:hypothetical protein [Pectobacterium carotovorum]MDY4376060.1 hypothetical protein [Pectobacterium carotovorum subsp. carotovorum]